MSKGIAPITVQVLTKLRAKHPTRREPVVDPSVSEVISMRRAEGLTVLDDDELCSKNSKSLNENGREEPMSTKVQAAETLDTLMPIIQVGAMDVIEAAVKAEGTVSRGLQQITPWMLKVAMTSTHNSLTSFYAAKPTNRLAKRDCSSAIGELSAMCKPHTEVRWNSTKITNKDIL